MIARPVVEGDAQRPDDPELAIILGRNRNEV
jgi:hypothetical protein